jgi:DNA-binding GntR family transcriptional regulator
LLSNPSRQQSEKQLLRCPDLHEEGNMSAASELVDALVADRPQVTRASTAERVAEVLRGRILEGLFPPGMRLSEESIGAALNVSRNTLREAFRLLCHERLAVHRLNQGVFVRVLTESDVVDLYLVRTVVECAGVRRAPEASEAARDAVRDAVDLADRLAAEQRWQELGTADLRFHQALVGLAESPRLDELMQRVLAELRLVFHVMSNPRDFHEAYRSRNRDICRLVMAGELDSAETALTEYLGDARRQLVDAYRASDGPPAGGADGDGR